MPPIPPFTGTRNNHWITQVWFPGFVALGCLSPAAHQRIRWPGWQGMAELHFLQPVTAGSPENGSLLGGGFKDFLFSPRKLRKMNPIWRAYFFRWVVQPPTSLGNLKITVDGSEIRLASLSHYLQGFSTIPGGCLGFLNHQQYQPKPPIVGVFGGVKSACEFFQCCSIFFSELYTHWNWQQTPLKTQKERRKSEPTFNFLGLLLWVSGRVHPFYPDFFATYLWECSFIPNFGGRWEFHMFCQWLATAAVWLQSTLRFRWIELIGCNGSEISRES